MSASMAVTQQGAIDPSTILADVEALGARIARVRAAIGRVIFGQDEVVDQTLITLLSGGHALLVGVPGLGKLAWDAAQNRDIPVLVAWVAKPFVTSIPKETLTSTLEAARRAVQRHRER